MTTPAILADRYRIGELLGYGGMSEVRRARDTSLGRDVAVKIMRSDLARDSNFYERFRREAQNSALLNHPSIVAVYDTGEEEVADGRLPYIVMELVEGHTVRDLLRMDGAMEPETALGMMSDVCGALDFSHRKGIIHRDIKPANVMVRDDGAVKVMDFGIARAVSESTSTLTQTSAVLGTAQYLSPEQARGETVDFRSDIYAAGCVLYEMLVGVPPFTGETPVSVAYQHVQADPRPPSEHRPELGPYTDAVVMMSMAKNPANRYQTAGDMRRDLLTVLSGQHPEAPLLLTDDDWGDDWGDDAPTDMHNYPAAFAAGAGAGALAGAGMAAGAGDASAAGGAGRSDGSDGARETAGAGADGGGTGAGAGRGSGAGAGGGGSRSGGSGPRHAAGPGGATVSTGGSNDSRATKSGGGGGRRNAGRILLALALVAALIGGGVFAFNSFSGEDDDSTVAVQEVTIPEIADRPVNEVVEQLESLGFVVQRENHADENIPENTVITSDPVAGKRIPRGGTVTLMVSTGAPILQVPYVMGMEEAEARRTLEEAGLGVADPPLTQPSSEADEGLVVETDPQPGSDIRSTDPVTITFGSGPEEITVPNVINTQEQAARQVLQEAGFRVSVSRVDSSSPQGQVLGQSVPGGQTDVRGATINLEISQGNRFQVPDLVGMTVDEALAALSEAGWQGNPEDLIQLPQNDPDLGLVGQVHSQQPSPGEAGVNDQIVLRVYRFGLVPGPG